MATQCSSASAERVGTAKASKESEAAPQISQAPAARSFKVFEIDIGPR
jgi:hypothetical protein